MLAIHPQGETAHIDQSVCCVSLFHGFGLHSNLERCDAGDKTPINKLTAITCVDEVFLLHTYDVDKHTCRHTNIPSHFSLCEEAPLLFALNLTAKCPHLSSVCFLWQDILNPKTGMCKSGNRWAVAYREKIAQKKTVKYM